MKINDTRIKDHRGLFEELPLGKMFEADDGAICIKIATRFKDDLPNIMYCVDGEWETGYEYRSSWVTPLNAEIIIS